ncbi:MAG: hypothetical protein IKS28_03905 [Clostridia bacterium]|nr:hypothetical protein [Clostridia bacterium]
MKNYVKTALLIVVAFACLVSCSNHGEEKMTDESVTNEMESKLTSETEHPLPIVNEITASNADFRKYIRINGRTYSNRRSGTVYFNYVLSGFEFNFTGTGVRAELVSGLGNGTEEKNCILNIYVDDMETPYAAITLNKTKAEYILAENLKNEVHHIWVVKRTDISYSSAGVNKIILSGDNASFLAPPAGKDRKILFMGDSITSGVGNLVSDGSGNYASKNDDATKTYAYFTATALEADLHVISRGGLGLVWNSSRKAPEDGGISLPMIFDYCNYYDDSGKTKWDHSSFVPDIVIINIGTNDKTSVLESEKNRQRWFDTYVEFLHKVKETYPDAPIICCYGSMFDDKTDLDLQKVVETALNDGLSDIYYLRFPKNDLRKFGRGVGNHPTVAKHKSDAEGYLIPMVRGILRW